MKSKEELIQIRKEILPLSKSWNQNRLFLVWGFLAAMMVAFGLELFRTFAKDLSFKLNGILSNYYFIGLLVFFIFSLVLIFKVSKIIDENANNLNNVVKDLTNVINSED
jgi:fructose-specific phosphotransferase system IIC component